MTTNAFAISRRLVEKGVNKETADAVAEEIVTHSDENLATKADIAALRGEFRSEINTVKMQINALTGITIGIFVGIVLILASNFWG